MGLFDKKKEIELGTIIQRRNDLLFNEIDGEVVMLSIENGEYYGIDKVGSRIWEMIKNPLSLNELIINLMKEFEVAEEQCSNDTKNFIIQLFNKKLIWLK